MCNYKTDSGDLIPHTWQLGSGYSLKYSQVYTGLAFYIQCSAETDTCLFSDCYQFLHNYFKIAAPMHLYGSSKMLVVLLMVFNLKFSL